MQLHPSWLNTYNMCLVWWNCEDLSKKEPRLFVFLKGGVAFTVQTARRHQLVGEAATNSKNLGRRAGWQLVSLSDLSADKPAGSFRRLFAVRRHDTQRCSALAEPAELLTIMGSKRRPESQTS